MLRIKLSLYSDHRLDTSQTLRGVMGDTGAQEQEGGGVRSTLVTSLAANIFDTLKSNNDIATILNGVLDPARKDKVYK